MTDRVLRLSLVFLAGCGTASSAARFTARITGCDADDILITDETATNDARTWIAMCRGERFHCGTWYQRPDVRYDHVTHVQCRREAEARRGPARSIRQFEEGRGPELEGFVEIEDVRLVLRAAPVATPNAITVSIELPRRLEERDCQVSFLAGDVPVSYRSIYAPFEHGGAWRFQIPYDDVERMGSAASLIGRLCGTEEFAFTTDQQRALVELVDRARRASVLEVDE